MSTSNSCDHSSSAGGHNQVSPGHSSQPDPDALQRERTDLISKKASWGSRLKKLMRQMDTDKAEDKEFDALLKKHKKADDRIQEINQQLERLAGQKRKTRR